MAEAVQETHVPPRAYKKAGPKRRRRRRWRRSGEQVQVLDANYLAWRLTRVV